MKKKADSVVSATRIEDLLFHALRTIYLFERAEIEQFDLNYQQMYLLKILKRKAKSRVSDLAVELRIPAFSATRLISQLEGKYLVVKSRDMKDRRNIFVQITAEGRDMLKRVESHIIALIISSLKAYSGEEAGLIMDVVRNLDGILGLRGGLDRSAFSVEGVLTR